MIQRGKDVGCDFELEEENFYLWTEVIGPVPPAMECPSVGRYDHSKGYVFDHENNRWNFRWEEWRDNNLEGAARGREAALAGPNHASKNPEIMRQINYSQLAKGTHNSQIKSSEELAKMARNRVKAAIANGNHLSQQWYTCDSCGRTIGGPWGKRHMDTKPCQTVEQRGVR
jgi:hypothetical protein